jgi:hydroxyacylglutathione hydrolase
LLFERIESAGLSHYSYMVGDDLDIAVIDPRRDCEVYLEKARVAGMRIALILETHRNEDYVVGSTELAERTGAEIWHADAQWDYRYGEAVEDGQQWKTGGLTIEALHTPGHTPGLMSYLLREPDGSPWMVFTGDSLFAGDVGRMDLLEREKLEEMAGLMYDSLNERLLPLGDGVIVCPAHGAGSICGSAISQRKWTTIGLERERNAKLQYGSRDEFIEKAAVMHERPPYFRRMERQNLEGTPLLGRLPAAGPASAEEFSDQLARAAVLDTRTELAFGAAHVPGAQSIWLDGLAKYGGWYLSYDEPVLLVSDGEDTEREVRTLVRMGFDDVRGYLAGGMLGWHKSGIPSARIQTYTVQDVCAYLDGGHELNVLDVRSEAELENDGRIPNAQHIHITQLPERTDEVRTDGTLHIFCGSGLRSMIAASYLERQGRDDVAVILGGLAGWRSKTCPIEFGEARV